MKRALTATLALTLAGCVYVFSPQVVTLYDEDCDVVFQKMELTVEQHDALAGRGQCSGEKDCLTFVAAVLMITPVSAIISGSIVVAGNTAYWMEHKGQCLAKA